MRTDAGCHPLLRRKMVLLTSHTVRRRPSPRLISELVALTTADGRSLSELARELEIDETTLMQYRSGRRPISMKTYARIMRRFSEHRLIRDLAFHYAAVEYHVEDQDSAKAAAPPSIPAAVERALTQYAERFAEETLHGGRGLFLTGPDRDLSAASEFLAQRFRAMKVAVCRIRADRKPAASEMRDALAAPLFVVERVDFLREDVANLISRRADLARPTIVTSTRGADTIADPYLRRSLAVMRAIHIGDSAAPTTVTTPQERAAT